MAFKNTGQSNFALYEGTAGADLNVENAIDSGITGSGVIVAVIDDGLELTHEDLVDNIVTGSYDFDNLDENPVYEPLEGSHGVAVAGIIAAKGFNGIGIRGVAPNASLIGYNLIADESYYISDQIKSWGIDPPIPVSASIFNMSYGAGSNDTYDFEDFLRSDLEAALEQGTTTLRDGKGGVYIQSAGNEFADYAKEKSGVSCGVNLTCYSMANDNYHSVPYIMTVGSLSANGIKTNYSSTGPGLWVTGFGGRGNGVVPGIMTTDDSGCDKGYVSTNSENNYPNPRTPFNSADGHPENLNCNYLSTFSGTSASAPGVSGVVALILEANPNLSWRGVKHVLAYTSVPIDLNRTYEQQNIPQYNWTVNAAGYSHHHWYGFGQVDASAAVTYAQSFNSDSLGNFFTTGYIDSGTTIQMQDLVGTVIEIPVTKPQNSSGIVEHVRLTIAFEHSIPYSVGIRLTSPSGTVIPVLQPYTNLGSSSQTTDIGVVGFYLENMEGTWQVEFIDYVSDSIVGTASAGIEIYGH